MTLISNLKIFHCNLNKSFFKFRLLLKGKKKYFDVFTHLTESERQKLYEIASSLQKKSLILEIGSYLGSSSTFLASGSQELDSKVFCIDTWQNEGMTEGTRDTFSEFKKNTEKLNNIIPLRGKSEEIGKKFNQKIDLLFIDGDHSYEAVKTDLNAWLPHTKNRTILIMHDYGWAEGVIRAVDEIVKPIEIKKGKSFENMYITHINGELFR